MSENASRGQQAAEEIARRWIATMQSLANQIQRQQQTFQQMMQESMNSYVQLLNNPPFSLPSEQSQEGQQAAQETFRQASQQWMQLVQQQQQTLQQVSRQWMEQAQRQQQTFQQIVQQSLSAYMDLFRPPR